MVSAELRNKARPWIEQQLATSSDLSASDLTEFVVTLLEDDGTREEVNDRLCKELSEFLHGATEDFVAALLNEIERLQHAPAVSEPQVATGGQDEFRRNFRAGRDEPREPHPNHAPQGHHPIQEQPQMPPFPFPIPGAENGFPPFPMGQGGALPMIPPFMMPGGGNFAPQGSWNRRGRGGHHHGGRPRNTNGRSGLSSIQNELSVANKRLVVEKIPDDKLSEESVIEYFKQFGTLTRVRIDKPGHLAEIEFESHDQAAAAHGSPAPIFDNRFVKVYWRKLDEDDPQEIDIESVRRMQAIKQQQFEEKEAKRREHSQKMQELISARATLLKEQEELIKSTTANAASGDVSNELKQLAEKRTLTENLKEQLEALKAEAASLGLTSGSSSPYSRGRGGYRGRGGPYSRGSYRGRGSMRGRGGFAHASLDLRPKSVLVKGVSEASEEPFRSHMVSINYDNLERQDAESVVIDFPDRRTAEIFFGSSNSVPDVGNVEKQWVRRDPPAGDPGAGTPASVTDSMELS